MRRLGFPLGAQALAFSDLGVAVSLASSGSAHVRNAPHKLAPITQICSGLVVWDRPVEVLRVDLRVLGHQEVLSLPRFVDVRQADTERGVHQMEQTVVRQR